jgi:DNA-binding GntR family transcriptional regulator
MPNNPTRRIPPATLQADLESFAALQAIEGYAPSNAAYTLAAITTAKQNMETKQTAETQAAAAAASARDAATDGEWAFHNAILGAKTQVTAQFGENSNQVQSLGLKKKSEYARPTRKPTKTGSGE